MWRVTIEKLPNPNDDDDDYDDHYVKKIVAESMCLSIAMSSAFRPCVESAIPVREVAEFVKQALSGEFARLPGFRDRFPRHCEAAEKMIAGADIMNAG